MAAMTRTLAFNQTLLNNIYVIKQYEKTLLMFLCLLCRHICRRVSSIWAINICMYVCMYVYEDSNFGFFRIPHIYVYAHKWLEHQILGKSLPVSNSRCVIDAATSKFLSKN